MTNKQTGCVGCLTIFMFLVVIGLFIEVWRRSGS